jgi:hypothetical protein
MSDYDDSGVPESLDAGRLAAHGMVVAAVLLALVAVVYAVTALSHFASTPAEANWRNVLDAILRLTAGWALAALLWGGAELLRRMQDVVAAQRAASASMPAIPAAAPPPRARPGDVRAEAQAHLLEELVELMREVRDIGLLSDAERAARLQHEAEQLVHQLERDVPALLREHNLQQAEQRVQRARQRFPSLPNWDNLLKQIEQARAKFEEHDLLIATREIDDLAALGAWDRAAEVVRALRQRHPNAEQVLELTRRVAIGRERATAEERARIMAQAQDATNRRDWPRALELVETLLARFPGSPEAAELRTQMQTLQANAEIQARQSMESQIRDLCKQHRFAEALRIANSLIERYPDSKQAAILRDQLPKLQQKAAEAA